MEWEYRRGDHRNSGGGLSNRWRGKAASQATPTGPRSRGDRVRAAIEAAAEEEPAAEEEEPAVPDLNQGAAAIAAVEEEAPATANEDGGGVGYYH